VPALPAGPQAQQRQEIDELAQAFGFAALLVTEVLAAILLVEQRLQSARDALRQSQPGEILGKVQSDLYSARSLCHGSVSSVRMSQLRAKVQPKPVAETEQARAQPKAKADDDVDDFEHVMASRQ
jgi:hypothetical protein